MIGRGDLKEIREALNLRVVEVCRQLLPDGRREGRLWVSTNPRVAGDERKIPALKVAIDGDAGAWTDWRNGRDGHAGDMIGLIAYLHGTDTKGALAWARDFLGLKTMSRDERRALRFAAEAKAKKAEKEAAAQRRRKLERAARLFFENTVPCGGISAEEAYAREYFYRRKVPFERMETLSLETFRFSRATEWWRGAEYKTDGAGRRIKARPGPSFPAVHSAMRQWNGEISACHVTFLDHAGWKKAPVEPPKLMFGEAMGAVIEVALGPTLESFWRCQTPGPLIIGEGIETAGALAVAVPEARVWAAGSLAGIRHAPVHLPCVSEIFVARDNNAGNIQAQKQLDAALEALEEADKPLTVMASHVGDDFNDLATGEE
jgi:hypothetical protein